jgi:hypothetical protein
MCLLQGPIKEPTRVLYLLVVDENEITCGSTRILWVLVVDEYTNSRGSKITLLFGHG